MLFAWALAGAVLVSAFLGYGTRLSNLLAGGWFAVFSVLLLAWPRMNLGWHRGIALVILLAHRDQMDGVMALRGAGRRHDWRHDWPSCTRQCWSSLRRCFGADSACTSVRARVWSWGSSPTMGSSREALAGAYLNDWRIGPLVLCVYGLFSWLLGIWVRERDDLRETAERVERLRKAANTDTLTGIANRRVAERALNLFATRQRRYAVMMIDIDHFKAINDQHGHDTGDRILQRIAEILKARMRVQDTVARWGGEEFLVVVESVTRDESASIAESLRHMIEQGTEEILKTTISIGVAHSETGQSVDQILKRADEGLYAAKNSGRNKVVTV